MSAVAIAGHGKRSLIGAMTAAIGFGGMPVMASELVRPPAFISYPAEIVTFRSPYAWRKSSTAAQRKRKGNRLHVSKRTKAKHRR